jgi:hypothetical protein
MTILLLGDSHTDIFLNNGQVTRFDMSKCNPTAFTINRFIDAHDADLWSRLGPWLEQNCQSSNQLVITGGEIDVRAHFWRHIPRHYLSAGDITAYINNLAVKFYQRLNDVAAQYNISNIVIWGAPAAGEKAHYNFEVPFGGPASTRNQLVHMWNREIVKVIAADPRFTFATAFYNFIDPVTFTTVTPNPSHDGVHWHDSFGPAFWQYLVLPAMNGQGSQVGENWGKMVDQTFDLSESVSDGSLQYDTWARTGEVSDVSNNHHHIHVSGTSYTWVPATQRNLLPAQYHELTLAPIVK